MYFSLLSAKHITQVCAQRISKLLMPYSFQDWGGDALLNFFKTVYSLLKLWGRGQCVPCHSVHVGVEKNFLAVGSLLSPCSEAGNSLVLVADQHTSGALHTYLRSFVHVHGYHLQLFAWVQGLELGLEQSMFLPTKPSPLSLVLFLWVDFSGRKNSVAAWFPCLSLVSPSDGSQIFLSVILQAPSPSTLSFLHDPISFFTQWISLLKPLALGLRLYIYLRPKESRRNQKRDKYGIHV